MDGHDHAGRILGYPKTLAQFRRQIGDRQSQRLHRRAGGRGRRLFGRGRCLLFGILEFADLDVEQQFLALAPHFHFHRLVDRRFGDDARQAAHVGHVLAVEAQHHVARLDAGDLGRAAVLHAGDERAPGLVEAEALGDLVGHALDVDAKPAAPRMAELPDLIDHRLGQVRRNGEADADRAARGREDRGVDADHLAVHVEHRSARIAAVDRGIGLEEIVIGAGIDLARARRQDSGRHRAAQPEGIADRQHPIADPDLVAVAELDRGERLGRFDAQQRQIGLGVLAHHLGLEIGVVLKRHGDLVRIGDDVVVGHHQARGIDDEARAERGRMARQGFLLAVMRPVLVEEILEEILETASPAGIAEDRRPPAGRLCRSCRP